MESPDINIAEIGGSKHIVHAKRPKNISEQEEFCKEEWGKIPKVKIERFLEDYRKHLELVISDQELIGKRAKILHLPHSPFSYCDSVNSSRKILC